MANSYLSHTTSTPTNSDKATLSFWLKRSLLSSGRGVFAEDTNGTNKFAFILGSNNTISIFQETGGTVDINLVTNRVFRDTSAWYNIVVAYDSSQGSASDRVKLYVNGSQETSFSTSTYPSSNVDFRFNKSGIAQEIGRYEGGNYFDGYLSHVAFVDGQALAPTVFGETDSTSGIWKFKQPSGVTWGTNGFWLKFENSGALGTDSSGNSNTFTVNGNGRQALDTPSNVHATGNPLYVWNYNLTQSNANLSFAGSQNQWQGASTNIAISKGKWYYEAKFTSGTDIINWGVGFMGMEDYNLTNATRNFVGFYNYDGGEIWVADASNSTATTADYGTFSNGDIIGIALDYDNTYLSVYKNGSAIVTNFDYGAVGTSSTVKGGKFIAPVFFNYGSGTASANFGNGYFGTTAITSAGSNGNGSLFEYDVPSGYYALNTKNINTYG
jgi:hypothetical protein